MAVAIKVCRGDSLPASRLIRPKGGTDESSAVQIPHGRLVAVLSTQAEIGMAVAVKILDYSAEPAGSVLSQICRLRKKLAPLMLPHCCPEGGHISENKTTGTR